VIVALAATTRADTPTETPAALRPALSTHGVTIHFTGYVQADAVVYAKASADEIDPSTNAPLNLEHFGIPRASLRADAEREAFAGELELEAFTTRATLPRMTQTSNVRIEMAQVRWRYHELVEVVGGLFRTPFGAQTPTSPRDRPFLELPTVSRALFPGDIDAGVMARGAYGLARWSVAMMNGAPVGDARWTGKDPTSSYDFVARIGADIPAPRRARVVVGISALSGTGLHPGTPPTKDQVQWVDENQNGRVDLLELQVIPGTPGVASQTFHRNALGGDVAWHWCLIHLGPGVGFAEGVLGTNLDRGLVYADPVAQARSLRELGFVAGVIQSFGPNAQAGVRYDRYDADRDSSQRLGVDIVPAHQVFSTLGVMAAARWNTTRFIVEYDHERNPFGRADDGTPTTRSADRVTLRAQVGF
jgi:hypothetical protein